MDSLEGWIGLADPLQCLAGGAAVKIAGLLGDIETAAKAGEQRLLEGQFAAEGVDGGDAELRGQVEELPAQPARVIEGAAGEGLRRSSPDCENPQGLKPAQILLDRCTG